MMGNFFRGWRQTIGVVTLAMALLLMGCWVRSRTTDDRFTICLGSQMYHVTSLSSGFILYNSYDPPPVDGLPVWWESRDNRPSDFLPNAYLLDEFDIYFFPYWSFPHWVIVTPLLALSALFLVRIPVTASTRPIATAVANQKAR